VGFDDLRIRDISRFSGEWSPPIGALGGPPAHELYRDLVLYAGLQLFQDARGRPWVVFRDGAQRRSFSVPSIELRSALDRFRMHRSARPLPRADLDEFVRIVEARVSDPDVKIPVLRSPLVDGAAVLVPNDARRSMAEPGPPTLVPPPAPATSEGGSEGTAGPSPAIASSAGMSELFTPPAATGTFVPIVRQELNPSISGGASAPPRRSTEVARYVRVLRRLVRDGDWIGTTRELSQATRDDPVTLYASLLRYRSELVENDLLLANVELGEGFRWLIVDAARLRNGVRSRPPTGSKVPAQAALRAGEIPPPGRTSTERAPAAAPNPRPPAVPSAVPSS